MFEVFVLRITWFILFIACLVVGKELAACIKCMMKYERFEITLKRQWLLAAAVSYISTIIATGISPA